VHEFCYLVPFAGLALVLGQVLLLEMKACNSAVVAKTVNGRTKLLGFDVDLLGT
jgi:hypothetical protein